MIRRCKPIQTVQSKFLSRDKRQTTFSFYTFNEEKLINILNELLCEAKAYEQAESMKNLSNLMNKLNSKQRTAVFCGHFSAGKSTLLNQLIGEDLLPSHPIPTSANIVHIQKGETHSLMYRDIHTGKRHETNTDYWSHDWFTDRNNAEEVYLKLPIKHFPDSLELIDTPGIDSTDHAHRLAAQSRLIEADNVYYIVDYQQVETTENFSFLKQLNDMFINPILIVNQIDKHNDEENPFSDYKAKIEKSLQQHHIELKDILYLSAAVPSKSQNDGWEKLLQGLIKPGNPDEIIRNTVALGIYRELENIALNLQDSFKPTSDLRDHMSHYSSLDAVKKEYIRSKSLLEEVHHWKNKMEKDLIEEFDRVFFNAKLTPYHTRNLIRDYLESRQPHFRLKGFFSINKKTAFEKKRRQEILLQSLNENVRNYIDIHLKNNIERVFHKYHLHSRSLFRDVTAIRHKVDNQTLKSAERKGAIFSQEYVLTYSRLIVDEIRKKYKKSLIQLFPSIKAETEVVEKKEMERLNKNLDSLQHIIRAWENWNDKLNKLYKIVSDVINKLDNCKQLLSSTNYKALIPTLPLKNASLDHEQVNLNEFYASYREETHDFKQIKEQANERLMKSLNLLNEVQGMTAIKNSLDRRMNRLRQKKYRIALFGAFSAGKSTIANALLGEKMLAVSANPTTAAVHYITAPDEHHPHKTFILKFKSPDEILQDMNDLLQPAGVTFDSVNEWQKLLVQREKDEKETEDNTDPPANEDEHQTTDPLDILKEEEIDLLNQFYESYHANFSVLGCESWVSNKEYKFMTANEKKALLIKEITIYFDCPFTREGYLLTDTPGAGSIYRRHSEAAYKEMREADAIIFVSYYNHSFSKADREFLFQLGRTKDYFSYDKMMFLVNACDLAKNQQEVTEVLQYVSKELQQFGIYKPKLYPVSGRLAFDADLSRDADKNLMYSGLYGFSKVFRHYANEVLEEMIVKDAYHDIKQAIRIIEDQLWTMQLKAEKRQSLHQSRLNELRRFQDYLKSFPFELEIERMMQELEELLFYVKQRVFYRYYDEFKEIFTITRMTEEQFDSQIYRFANEMIYFIFHELSQEVRATVIRIEHFINEQWRNIQGNLMDQLSDPLKAEFIKRDNISFPDLTIQEEILLSSSSLSFIKQYTSYRDFFAGQQSKHFKEKLEESIRPYGDQFIKKYHKQLEEFYEYHLRKEWGEVQSSYVKTIENLQKKYNSTSLPNIDSNKKSVLNKLKELMEW